jgi:hypothetical protein
MGSLKSRSVFAAALCAGVAMVGGSAYGLVGVDAELQRSALAAQQRGTEEHSLRVVEPRRDCPAPSDDSQV